MELAGIKHRSVSSIAIIAILGALSACGKSTSGDASVSEENATADHSDAHAPASIDPRDDGSQLNSAFRLNYAGYLPLQEKVAVYINESSESLKWSVKNSSGDVVAKGETDDRRENDFASGDTFFLIDFSQLQEVGEGYTLVVGDDVSSPFDISENPYRGLAYEFYDYFKDHRRTNDTFDRAVHNWTDHSLTIDFIADAGDQGFYTVNASDSSWSLSLMLERFPEVNEYFHKGSAGKSKVYDELKYLNGPMDDVIFPGETLAVGKLATFTNETYALCPGADGIEGPCISQPETKSTYAVARTLAVMARLHSAYGDEAQAKTDYDYALMALKNAEETPFVCLTWDGFGGEGGYYPNNDNYSLWREPRTHRDPCAEGEKADPKDNNINDDHYAAMVDLLITAEQRGDSENVKRLTEKVLAHSHHNRVDMFFWGAVSTQATLSLLTHRPEGMDLSQAEANVFAYADQVIEFQNVGYPGVTFDAQATVWHSEDNDDKDANWRWASNRMQLNDARVAMFAAELAHAKGDHAKAAAYTNAVLKVIDQMSGTNAVALAMYTSDDFPFIEFAVTRTHDRLVPDTEDGKMALGPNNWTNSNDPDMPAFGSMPGMKMFTLTGTGWASREISIDGNASLIPVMYWATEKASAILAAAQQ